MTAASRIVEGEALRVGEREIVPIVRVRTVRWSTPARRFGMGGGSVGVVPVAVIERVSGRARRIRIRDATAEAVRTLAIGALLVWGVLWIMRRGARDVR